MKYIYQARTKEGKLQTGTVEASSKEAAALLLQKYNIVVTSIKEASPPFLERFNISLTQKISKKDLAIFSRQLAVMLKARVSVVQSLRSLALQTKRSDFRDKIFKIAQLVEEGNSLSEAFGNFPEIFNSFYLSLIKRGETTGKIADSLQYLSQHLEREYDITTQVRNAMIYPIFILVVLTVVLIIVMFFVMPRLVDLLQQTTVKPPFFTQLMINFYSFLYRYGLFLGLGTVLIISVLVYYFTTREGRKVLDSLILKIPFFNALSKKIFLIRFTENLSTLIIAGLSINNALRITKDTVSNTVYKKILEETERDVISGEKMSASLVKHPQFIPPFVIQMIQVGEETGKLDKNLLEIAHFYQKEVDRAINNITTLLEPILIVGLGIIVAILAISIIQPLYETLGTI